MPELPEVETIKRDLERFVLNKEIIDVRVADKRVLNKIQPEELSRCLLGQKIIRITRRGKAVIFDLSGGRYLMVQPKMTGQLIYGLQDHASKVTLKLSDQKYLNYNDQRLFGKISVLDDLDDSPFLKSLGPEPLDSVLNAQDLRDRLRRRVIPIKPLLLNQNFIAGIGNIYASEILFRAAISPKRRARSLRLNEVETLIDKTREVLNEAIAWRGTSMRNYIDVSGQQGEFMGRIKVYGRKDEPCTVCRTLVIKIVQGGRSTFYCRRCQK